MTWTPPTKERREEWLRFLGELNFGAVEEQRGRLHDPWKCEAYKRTAGVGRPARGESWNDGWACGSMFCPECAAYDRYRGVIWGLKSRLRAFESEVSRALNLRPEVSPMRYLLVNLCPPEYPEAFFYHLAARRMGISGEEAERLVARLVGWLHSTKKKGVEQKGVPKKVFARDGVLEALTGDCSHDAPKKLWDAAIKELLRLAVRTVEVFLRRQLGLSRPEVDFECRFPLTATVHFLSQHGFYPHAVVLVPEYFQVLVGGSWEWRLFPEPLFAAYERRRQLCTDCDRTRYADLPPEQRPCRHCGRLLGVGLAAEALSPAWVSAARSAGREAWKQRLDAWLLGPARPMCPDVHADVRVVSADLEAAVNYSFAWPLTKTYRRFLEDPESVRSSWWLRTSVYATLRYALFRRPCPRLVVSTGPFSSKLVSREYSRLAGVPVGPGRVRWSHVREDADHRAADDDEQRTGLRDAVHAAWEDALLTGDVAESDRLWRAFADIVLPSPNARSYARELAPVVRQRPRPHVVWVRPPPEPPPDPDGGVSGAVDEWRRLRAQCLWPEAAGVEADLECLLSPWLGDPGG